ncbi:MAG: iron-sulfur cluster carrier protein ApbC [Gammaproteobacteria bacterium]
MGRVVRKWNFLNDIMPLVAVRKKNCRPAAASYSSYPMREKIQEIAAAVAAENGFAPVKIALSGDGDSPRLALQFPYPAKSIFADAQRQIADALRNAGLPPIPTRCEIRIHPHIVQGGVRRMPRIKNIIAVASGKGGVGKSATAVNLALALSAEGARAGILDADIYGPSVPVMLGIRRRPQSGEDGGIQPLVAHGVQAMSVGFLTGEDQPAIWRGPMATRALSQLLQETRWDDLDYLVLDMPPGTGDIQLTAAQKFPITGAIVVTTPQDLALSDAQRGLVMFRKVSIPVLGIVENMGVYLCPHCGRAEHIFGGGGAKKMCEKYDVKLLGELPLAPSIRADADAGTPTVIKNPDGEIAARYRRIARAAAAEIAQKPRDHSAAIPQVVAEK